MLPKTAIVNRCVFLMFTIQLVVLQLIPRGLDAYFSVYVAREWHRSGYLLYGALIYLFAMYSLALFRREQFFTGSLQVLSLVLLIGVMAYPFYSLDHISLLPFLAALQPIILFCDRRSASCDDVHEARRILNGIIFLLIISPAIFCLMFFPIIEKVMIYVVIAMLFAALQVKTRALPC